MWEVFSLGEETYSELLKPYHIGKQIPPSILRSVLLEECHIHEYVGRGVSKYDPWTT